MRNEYGEQLYRMVNARQRLATDPTNSEANVLRRMQAKLWSAAEFVHWQRTQQADAQPAQPQRPRHAKHDELAELAEIFRLTTQSLRKWVAITGRHPDIQEADRALRHLIATTRRILEAQ